MATIRVGGNPVVAIDRTVSDLMRDLGEDPSRFNRVDWPAGASRPATGSFLINEQTHTALLASDLSVEVPILMDDGQGGVVAIERMYQYAHRPLDGGGADGIYELQLVDERQWWKYQTASAKGYNITLQSDREKRYDDTEGSSDTAHTWTEVLGELMDDLGVTDRVIEVPVGSGKESPTDVHTQGANAAEMVDRLASACGLMLFIDYTGSTPAYSLVRPDTEQAFPASSELVSGGVLRPDELLSQGKAWRQAVMPAQVRVLFPRDREFTSDESTADEPAVMQYSEYTSSSGAPDDGRPGTEVVVHDGTWAIADSSTPTNDSNSTDLQSRADYLATRYYQRWRVQHMQGRYRGWLDNGPVAGTIAWMQTPAGPMTEINLSPDNDLYGGDRAVVGDRGQRIRGTGNVQVWEKWWGDVLLGTLSDLDRIGIITSQTAATGDRNTYKFKWAEKGSAGYGGWQAKSGDTEKTAYNLWEELDPGTTISTSPAGNNSVTIDGVTVGRMVLIRSVPDGAGGSEYWIVAGGVPVDLSVSC